LICELTSTSNFPSTYDLPLLESQVDLGFGFNWRVGFDLIVDFNLRVMVDLTVDFDLNLGLNVNVKLELSLDV